MRKLVFDAYQYDKDKFIKAYDNHCADVTEYFKYREDDLLTINICDDKDGWEKLCLFLNKPIPKVDFPFIMDKKKKN